MLLDMLVPLTAFGRVSNVDVVERSDDSDAQDGCIGTSINFYACVVKYT
jgi:hypothetical protein